MCLRKGLPKKCTIHWHKSKCLHIFFLFCCCLSHTSVSLLTATAEHRFSLFFFFNFQQVSLSTSTGFYDSRKLFHSTWTVAESYPTRWESELPPITAGPVTLKKSIRVVVSSYSRVLKAWGLRRTGWGLWRSFKNRHLYLHSTWECEGQHFGAVRDSCLWTIAHLLLTAVLSNAGTRWPFTLPLCIFITVCAQSSLTVSRHLPIIMQ